MQLVEISGKVVLRLLRGQALYLKEQIFTEEKKREAKKERREEVAEGGWGEGGRREERKKKSRNFSSSDIPSISYTCVNSLKGNLILSIDFLMKCY